MPASRQCDRCHQLIMPRGGMPPKYCPRCGFQLSSVPFVPVAAHAAGPPRITALAVLAAILAGIAFATGPVTGVPAIVVAIWARGRIAMSRGYLTGLRVANVAIAIAVLAMVFRWLSRAGMVSYG